MKWLYATKMVRSPENKEFQECCTWYDGSCACITLLFSHLMNILFFMTGRQGVFYRTIWRPTFLECILYHYYSWWYGTDLVYIWIWYGFKPMINLWPVFGCYITLIWVIPSISNPIIITVFILHHHLLLWHCYVFRKVLKFFCIIIPTAVPYFDSLVSLGLLHIFWSSRYFA